MESKVILITGASSGLGAALARHLSSRGHLLALVARRANRLDALAEELSKGGRPTPLLLPADLADRRAHADLIASTLENFGRLDVLINNAGIGLPEFYSRSEPDELARQIEVNMAAPILLTREALPSLIEAKGIV